jgi:hypothetical protein
MYMYEIHMKFWKETLEERTTRKTYRHRLEGNIRMDLTKWEGKDWIHLSQNRDRWGALVNMMMDLCTL